VPPLPIRRCWSPISGCRPTFQREGIDAAKEVRKRNPGTGTVVLSQYEDPEYAVSLLAEGSTGPHLSP
jgi:DNA-binding NarL/FixJ family response regulator